VAGLATDNGSRAIVLAGQLYFKENTYGTTLFYARGNLNYDLFGLGSGISQSKLPLKQSGQALFVEFLRRVGWKFFVGPRFFKGSSLITLRTADAGAVPLPPDIELQTSLTALGFRLDRDTRPNRFYPTAGTFLDFTSDFYSEGLGSKYSFQSYNFTFNNMGVLQRTKYLPTTSSSAQRADTLRSTEIVFTVSGTNCEGTLLVATSIGIWSPHS
jgi:outer membrane protein assembly factor BamA